MHVQDLVKKLKSKLGFFFRIKSCLSFESILEIHHKLKISHSSLFTVFLGRMVLPRHLFIYKAVLGLLSPYLNTYIIPRSAGTYYLRPQNLFLLAVLKARTIFGKKAFNFAAPSAWNQIQNELQLMELN